MAAITSADARTGLTLGPVAVEATSAQVDEAVVRAVAAKPWLNGLGRVGRRDLLEALAAGLESRADLLIEIGDRESGLGVPRLTGELGRTCYQLRFMGRVAAEGSYLEASIESAGTNPAGPVPDLRRINVPIGVVGVFGASNFPLAFSAPGGDTASALAAGCPIIVKAHPSHPILSTLVAEIFGGVLQSLDAPQGVFQLIFGTEAGAALVAHPQVDAIGFTGSVSGGRALFDIASARPRPIPFYGELGSVNPLVVTSAAATERGQQIGTDLAASMTLGVGQFCTKPGLFVIPSGEAGSALIHALVAALAEVDPGHLLNDGIRTSFRAGTSAVLDHDEVRTLFVGVELDRRVAPVLVEVEPDALAGGSAEALVEEHFGPFGLVVRYDSPAELRNIISAFPPALTGTVHTTGDDDPLLAELTELMLERSGRVVYDGFPTGVAIAWGMNHGGQYPASTSTATSVGASSIMRWVRPVAYQNAPARILPAELRDADVDVPRRVDGELRLPTPA